MQYKILNKNNKTFSNSIQVNKTSGGKKKHSSKNYHKIKSFKATYLATGLQILFLI